jgi:sarcosine oxidase delta subunit
LDKELTAADKKADYKLADKVSNSQYEAYTFKFDGITGFNANGWLAGGGDGYYYVPMKKTVKGKKVNVLRVGGVLATTSSATLTRIRN